MRFLGWQLHHWLLLISAAVGLAVFPALVHGTGFYYIDDAQTQFLPAFHEIGRQLSQFQLPLISLRSWHGGNLVGEYQYAIFNPFSDLLYLAFYLSEIPFSCQATIFATCHLTILAAGTFVGCRALRCRFDEALYIAVLSSSGIWLIYWASMTWLPLLAALSWFSWAVAGLIWLQENRRWFLGTSISVAMTGLAGSPQVDLVLVIVSGSLLLALWRRGQYAMLGVMLAALIAGLAMSLPAILPLMEAFAASTRPAEFAAGGYLLPPQALFALGLPVFVSSWTDWDSTWRVLSLPQAYVDWAFPILCATALFKTPTAWRDHRFVPLFWSAVSLFILAMLPSMGFLRYPTRFLPAALILAGLAVARSLVLRRQEGHADHGWSWLVVTGSVACPTLVAILVAPRLPAFAPAILAQAATTMGLAFLVVCLPTKYRHRWAALLTLMHIGIFALLISFWPTNPGLVRFAQPDRATSWTQQIFNSNSNTLFLVDHLGRKEFTEDTGKLYGNVAFALGGRSISGYSALGPASVVDFFGFGHLGDSRTDRLERLFQQEANTSVSFARLFRIDRIFAETGDWARRLERVVPPDWAQQSLAGTEGMLFTAPANFVEHGGSLSFIPPGVTAALLRFEDRQESWSVTLDDRYDGGPLVFARPWYPGYHVYLNGKEARVEQLDGIVPAVRLPAGFAGTVSVSFMPNVLILGVIISLLSLAAAVALQYRWRARPGACENPPVVV